jgi:hypothetical protein
MSSNRLEAIIEDLDRQRKRESSVDEIAAAYCIAFDSDDSHISESKASPIGKHYAKKIEFAQEIYRLLREGPVPKLRRELEELKKTVEAQGRIIETLLIPDEPKMPPENEYDIWLKSEEAHKYAGQYIAYARGHGVIASSPSLEELMPMIEGRPEEEEIVIEIVPRAGQ